MARFIADRCTDSVRQIEGTLTKVQALASLTPGHGNGGGVIEVGHALVDHLFSADLAALPRRAVRFATILQIVSGELAVTREQVLGSGRHRNVVLARALVIDPSCVGSEHLSLCAERGLNLEGIVLTHSHVDHTRDAARMARESGAPVLAHREAAALLQDAEKCGAVWLQIDFEPVPVSRFLEDGDRITVGNQGFEVIHTPGHSPDSICLLGDGVCFTGDLLFRDGVGRWDLPGGDPKALRESLARLVNECGDATTLYPGHGEPTTMGRERAENPYLLEWL